jgi:hypothetical protein
MGIIRTTDLSVNRIRSGGAIHVHCCRHCIVFSQGVSL